MSATRGEAAVGWAGAWPDALAFAGGLAVAWFARWETTDLIWSLWLSSLVVGYAIILWNLSATLREFTVNAVRDPTPGAAWPKVAFGALLVVGFLLGLAFFSVHFGGFHFGHSVFLNAFFPLDPADPASRGIPTFGTYAEVVRRYWLFLPLAFLAERGAFRSRSADTADTAVTTGAIEKRKRETLRSDLSAPYRNVVRMHLLIFFFAGAHILELENFAIYAVVYAVYFFPWRQVFAPRKPKI